MANNEQYKPLPAEFEPTGITVVQMSDEQYNELTAGVDKDNLWDYPVSELSYLCDPANEKLGSTFALLSDGRLHELP